jgi:hypothetical protein
VYCTVNCQTVSQCNCKHSLQVCSCQHVLRETDISDAVPTGCTKSAGQDLKHSFDTSTDVYSTHLAALYYGTRGNITLSTARTLLHCTTVHVAISLSTPFPASLFARPSTVHQQQVQTDRLSGQQAVRTAGSQDCRQSGQQAVRTAGSQDSRQSGQQAARTAGSQDSRQSGQQADRTAGSQDSRQSGQQVVRTAGRQDSRQSEFYTHTYTLSHTHTHTHKHTHSHSHTHTHTHKHTHTHSHKHTHTHKHTHSYTHTHKIFLLQ